MSYLGIRGFEAILRGGIPQRAEVLLLIPDGPPRYLVGAHWAIEGLKRGERVLVVLSGESPDEFLARLGRMGVDAKAALESGSLVILDWHTCWTEKVGGVVEVGKIIQSSQEAEDLLAAIEYALRDLPPAAGTRAFVDVLPRAVTAFEGAALKALIDDVRARLVALSVTSVFIADRAAPERTLAALTRDFHAILDAKDAEAQTLAFAVLRVGGAKLSPRYRRVRMREDGASVEGQPTTRTFSCPICDARVPFDAERCPSCGTPRADMAHRGDQPGLMSYLESLGRKEGVETPGRVAPRPAAQAAKPGFTNGMRPAERAGRVNGTMPGRVNGTAPGRVNGTAPGRVNGVGPKGRTNGVARAGMVNGTRGRSTTGVTNGLTNGLLRARSGITNGLTNGSGFTNGLGGRRARTESRIARWKLYLVPLIAAALLVSPLLVLETPAKPVHVVDGDPSEWSGAFAYTQAAAPGVNHTVALTRYQVDLSVDGNVNVLASVASQWFEDRDSVDALYTFLDTDRNPATGYRVQGLGADALAVVQGTGGAITVTSLRTWPGGNADRDNWTAWQPAGSVSAAFNRGDLEFQFAWETGWPGGASENPTFLLLADDGKVSRSYSIAFDAKLPALRATVTAASETVTGSAAPFVSVALQAFGGSVTVTGVVVTLTGGATEVSPSLPVTVTPGPSQPLTIAVDVASVPSGTLITANVTSVSTQGNVPVQIVGGLLRAYVTAAPVGKRVDGWFGDWGPELSADTDAAPVIPDLDLNRSAANRTGTTLSLYVDVKGDMLSGSPVPVHRVKPTTSSSASASEVPSRVAGEDVLRVYIDLDRNAANGTPILGLRGADLLLEVRGIHGFILSKAVYAWQGTWQRVGTANVANDERRLEANLSVPLSGAIEVAFQTSGWQGPADSTPVSGTRGVRSDGDGYRYEGAFTATFAPNGIVDITAKQAQFAWTLPDVYADGGAWSLEATAVGVQYSRPGVEVRYAIDRTGMREDLVLAHPGLPPELTFPITWGNRTMIWRESGQPLGVYGGQEREFDLADPFAVDATGAVTPLSLSPDLAAMSLRVPLPSSLASAVYPVTIDPAVLYYLYDNGTTYKQNEDIGWSVAVGDFNGDGYADVLTGAPLWSYGTHTNIGYAYIYYGPFSANRNAPDVWVNGTTDNLKFGYSVAAGKFNNDAYWDALISRVSSTVVPVSGPVCIVYGSASLSGAINSCDVKIEPPSSNYNLFGNAVAAGNVDNKFYDDVLVGEPAYQNAGSNDGVAYLYKSPFSSDVTSANYTLYPSTNATGQFGKAVAIGTIDSDASADIVVGEPAYSTNNGRVGYFKGSRFTGNSGSFLPDVTIGAPQTNGQFGSALAVGRINADAYSDLLVGAFARSTNDGAAYIFLSNSDGSGFSSGASPAVTLAGTNGATERFGTSVAIMDWNNDNTPDIFIGAPTAAGNGGSPSGAGRMYWYDNPLVNSNPSQTIYGNQLNEHMGQSLAVGKFANDPFVLLIIGAYGWPKTSGHTDGRVVVASIAEAPMPIVLAAIVVPPIVLGSRARRRNRSRSK